MPCAPRLCRSGSPDPDLFVIRRSQTTEEETHIVTMEIAGDRPPRYGERRPARVIVGRGPVPRQRPRKPTIAGDRQPHYDEKTVLQRSRGTGNRATGTSRPGGRAYGIASRPGGRAYRKKSRPGGLSYPDITRKFPSNSFPATVRIDSGWNCTPQTGNVLCRSPMISPWSVHAVTFKHAGNVSLLTMSE